MTTVPIPWITLLSERSGMSKAHRQQAFLPCWALAICCHCVGGDKVCRGSLVVLSCTLSGAAVRAGRSHGERHAGVDSCNGTTPSGLPLLSTRRSVHCASLGRLRSRKALAVRTVLPGANLDRARMTEGWSGVHRGWVTSRVTGPFLCSHWKAGTSGPKSTLSYPSCFIELGIGA